MKGIGVDLIKIQRIKGLCARRGEKALQKLFTSGEIRYAKTKKLWWQHLAARFAAKEAVYKAFGGGRELANWKEIEVINAADGRPCVVLHGAAKKKSDALGVKKIEVSLTHSEDHAVGVAILL